jgi:D-alanyl-D-alanine carboxypeptidase
MTALLVLERLELTDAVWVSETAVQLPASSSTARLKAGEELTVEQALYAMLLPSGNDAANALAETAAGSLGGFAGMMNRRAKELGAENSVFSNPHGLPRRDHLTTAYDMALITRAALETPGFLDCFGAASYPMPATGRNSARFFSNTHRMLQPGDRYYDRTVIGGKTGYTRPSGYTLVTAAEREGRRLICVVLGSEDCYGDTKTLLDFGFYEFSPLSYGLESAGAPPAVTLWAGDREAGVAYLSAPESVSLLVPNSAGEEDIRAYYRVPERPGADGKIDASLEIRLDGGGVPGLPVPLLSIPLRVETFFFDTPAAEAALKGAGEAESGLWGKNSAIPPFLIAFGGGAALLRPAAAMGESVYKRRARKKQGGKAKP